MSASETGVVTNTSIGIQNMHLAYNADGNSSVYKPVPVSGAINSPAVYHQVAEGGTDMGMSAATALKRKRGRPRKYAPDGNMGLALNSPPPNANAPPPAVAVGVGGGGFSGSGALQFTPSQAPATAHPPPPHPPSSSSSSLKKGRGRPPGSGKKNQHQLNNLGSTGIGFTPHVITVKAGEDVASRIMSFSQNGPRAVCILSANGAISNVTLRQAAMSGGTVTYEGRFEILSLSGSFMLSESAGHRSRIGGLSVSLAGPDGCVLGGGVAGLLTAASPVQVVVGSFMAEERQELRVNHHQMEPLSAPQKLISGMGFPGQSSPPSRGTPSESSGGAGSPMNQSMGPSCNNNNQPGMLGVPWK